MTLGRSDFLFFTVEKSDGWMNGWLLIIELIIYILYIYYNIYIIYKFNIRYFVAVWKCRSHCVTAS